MKATVIGRIPPDVILFPVYGKNCIMWQDITGKRRSSKGRIPYSDFIWKRDLEMEMVQSPCCFPLGKMPDRYGGTDGTIFGIRPLTSEYTDYLQFYRKNSELTQERKTKDQAQLQQCNNKAQKRYL